MFSNFKDEKKVEYLELVYDLIFVYLIRKNNSLLHNAPDGIIGLDLYTTYIFCTFAIIQIWFFTTFYINRYGKNGIKETLLVFANMYLLYYMGDGTRVYWHEHYKRYSVAWALILFNIAIAYYTEYRHIKSDKEKKHVIRMMTTILIQSFIVAVSLPIYTVTGISIAPFAVLTGIVLIAVMGKANKLLEVDFPHLTERVMLYVVLTFGEMIIGIASHFGGKITPASIFYSLIPFLITVGLFLSYGTLYDNIIDRQMSTNATGYMLIHMFLIFALTNMTTALEYMNEEENFFMSKTILMACSLLLYYLLLFAMIRYSKKEIKIGAPHYFCSMFSAVCMILSVLLYKDNSYVCLAVMLIYIYVFYAVFYRVKKR